MNIPGGNWTWLEIAKLAVALLGPIAILVLGLWIKSIVDRIDQRRWAVQNTIKWRLTVFDRLAPKLNLLLSAYTYVGRWKELRPPEIVALKRDLDEIVFTYDFLWSETLKAKYQKLMEACFQVNQGPGKDAKIAANVEMFRRAHANSDFSWDELFVSPDTHANRADIFLLVTDVLRVAVQDLELNLDAKPRDGSSSS